MKNLVSGLLVRFVIGFSLSLGDSLKIGSLRRGRARLRRMNELWESLVTFLLSVAHLWAYRLKMAAIALATAHPDLAPQRRRVAAMRVEERVRRTRRRR